MIDKLKNWWFAIAGILVVILDQGFDVINPILSEIGVSGRWIDITKAIFALYAIYRLKMQPPSLKTFADDGSVQPGKGL